MTLASLGLVVGPRTRVIRCAQQIVEVDAPQRLCIGGHDDDPRRGTVFESIQEQVREQERRQVVDREGVFQAVCGYPPVGPESAHIVHQDIQSRVRVERGRGQSADLGL